MKELKRRVEFFSFFNQKGICNHLEKMAQKGWIIDHITSATWHYRRTEPSKLHFAISYYPKASEFDPEPTEGQKRFHQFCAHTGWKLACTSAQMQIFYNEQENPTPIETEPELELQAIHASARKNFLPSYLLILVIAILQGGMFIGNLKVKPLDVLSSPSKLVIGLCFILLLLLCFVELGSYFIWHSKAKKTVAYGYLPEMPDTTAFQKGIMVIALAMFAYWMINQILVDDPLRRWIAVLMCFYAPVLLLSVNATKSFLKRRKASRGVNRTVTFAVSFFVAFAWMAMVINVTLWGISSGFLYTGEETYSHNGATWVIHQDELPLLLEDFTSVDSDIYSKERSDQESIFLGQHTMRQTVRYDIPGYIMLPELSYTVTRVKIPAMYEFCKARMIKEQQYQKYRNDHTYRLEDPQAWGAKEVYRLEDPETGVENTYLLCFEGHLVEIYFDQELTIEQKGIIGQKLKEI